MLKFLAIPGELLQNPDLRSDQKILLAYLLNLSNSNRYFYGSVDYLADCFGTFKKNIETTVQSLISLGFISKDAQGALRLTCEAEDLYNYTKSTESEREKSKEISKEISQIAKIHALHDLQNERKVI